VIVTVEQNQKLRAEIEAINQSYFSAGADALRANKLV